MRLAVLPESLRHDLALAGRSLRRRPAFTAVVALTLGLGIGANTAVFGVVDAVLLRPLPYPSPGDLVVVWGELPGQGRLDSHLSGPELAAIWEGSRFLRSMGAVFPRPGVLRGDDGPVEEVEIGWVTPGFLETLGVRPHVGRLPTPEEHVAEPSTVMVLSFELWERRYGADPGVLGRAVDFDGERRTVVGVMPRGFRMLFPPDQGVPERLAAWLPWGGRDYRTMPRGFRAFTPVARLAGGATAGQAAGELRALAARAREESVDYASSGFGLRLEPLAAGVVAHVRPTLLVLFGVAALVLLVACANAANLTLARAAESERDLRVRAALGARRGRLLRQLLTESALLGALGGGVGLVLAEVGLRLVRALEPGRLPRIDAASLDPRALACAAAAAAAASVLFGGIAALQALRAVDAASLQDGARGASSRPSGARGMLVVSQLALSLVLLAGAGLLVRTYAHLRAID
ncbi:MAG TPA: ABC transporter permease, partial [Vicinamibacteria bacterium]